MDCVATQNRTVSQSCQLLSQYRISRARGYMVSEFILNLTASNELHQRQFSTVLLATTMSRSETEEELHSGDVDGDGDCRVDRVSRCRKIEKGRKHSRFSYSMLYSFLTITSSFVVSLLLTIIPPMLQQTSERNPVLLGYDVVQYHFIKPYKEGGVAVRGKPEFAFNFEGYQFWFSSKENRDLFIGDPWKYAPMWGGFCESVCEN